MRLLILTSFLCAAVACSSHRPEATPTPPPPEIHAERPPQLQGCTIKAKMATCECVSASTRIDVKTGKSVVICKLNVR